MQKCPEASSQWPVASGQQQGNCAVNFIGQYVQK
jgi:hypothetical protein